ncbi:hypothetical protein GCM10009712_37510 [Pseudarthrobacter sulfonivorans]
MPQPWALRCPRDDALSPSLRQLVGPVPLAVNGPDAGLPVHVVQSQPRKLPATQTTRCSTVTRKSRRATAVDESQESSNTKTCSWFNG